MAAQVSSTMSASAESAIATGRTRAAAAANTASNANADRAGAAPPAGFSSAMADAAQAERQAAQTAQTQARDNKHSNDTRGDTKADVPDATVADAAAGAARRAQGVAATAAAAAARGRDANANATLPTDQNVIPSTAAAPAAKAISRDRSAAKSDSAAPWAGDAAAANANPQALAMLLAAGVIPPGGGATAISSGGRVGDASGNPGKSSDTDSGVTGAVSGAVAGALAGAAAAAATLQAGQSKLSGQSAQPARDAAVANTDGTDAAISAAAAAQDTAAVLPLENSNSPSHNDQSGNMSGSVPLPDLTGVLSAGAPPAPPPAVDATVAVPVGSGSWPHAVAAQVHWFVNNGVQSATLRLAPEHLGPVEVHIDVQSSQVNVNFSAAHAETRAALEQTVPRLRELFASGGLTLGQANVQSDPRSGSQNAPLPVRTAFTQASALEPVATTAARSAQSLGLVDAYA
jgi:flagellar hook-length control protein FliK